MLSTAARSLKLALNNLTSAFEVEKATFERPHRGRKAARQLAVQILLDHSQIESTVLYLGVDIQDALELAERTEP